MKKLLLAFLFAILCSIPARAQTPVLVQGGNPSATLVVCTFPAIGYPCTNPATIYTTSALSTPISQPVALGFGSIIFYVSSASNYMAQITGGDSRQFIIYGGAGAGSSFTAGGDLSGTSSSQTVIGINGTPLSGLGTGLLKNTTGTGVPSIAVEGTDYVLLWNHINAPTGNLTLAVGSNSSIFTTTSAVSQFFAWKNITAALVGASQSSPLLSLCGTEWTGASAEGCFTAQFVPGTGVNAANTIAFGHSGSATGVTTTTFPGPIQAGASTNAGAVFLPGNTANPAVPANSFGIIGPPSASFTSYALSIPSTAPSGTQYLGCGTPSSSISTCTWGAGGGSVTSIATTAPLGGGTITTTGTLTCTTCTTNASANTSNVLTKGAGGQAIQASSITDNATTVTTTDTGGYVAPVFTSNGSTAGFFQCTQGTANGHATANTLTQECPAAVTAYEFIWPGSASTGILALTNAANVVTGSITTTPTLTATNFTGYAFPLTVTGAVSGAIPCGTSTTTLTMGAILNTNILVKGGGAGACPSNSLITDNGTTATYTGTGGYSAPQLVSTVATGTAPLTVTSTTTVPNLTVSNHPKVQFCGTTTTCSATAETSPKIVFGSAPLVSGTPSTATVTGISPAFTATADYVCTVSAPGASAATALIGVTNVSASSFTITGPATVTTVISYICVGF